MKRVELVCFLLFVLTLVAAYSGVVASDALILVAVIICTGFYLVSGLGLTRNTFLPAAWKYTAPPMRAPLVMKTFSGLVFSFCILAVGRNELFYHHAYWPAVMGVIFLTIIMLFSMLLLEKEHPKLNRDILLRSALLSAGLTLQIVTPLGTRLAWRFDDVYYREILQFSLENPDDEEARRDVLEYQKRMEGQVTFEPIE